MLLMEHDMTILKRILNEDFLDDIADNGISHEEVDAGADESSVYESCLFGFMVKLSAIPKQKKMDFTERVSAYLKMLDKSLSVATRVREHRPLNRDTVVAIGFHYGLCNTVDKYEGQSFIFKGPPYDPLEELIVRRRDIEIPFYVDIDVSSIGRIATGVSQVVHIATVCAKRIFGNQVNAGQIDLFTASGEKPGRHPLVTVNMTIANCFDSGDLHGVKFLIMLVRQMNPELCGDNYERECWDYIENRHKKIGMPAFIKDIRQMFKIDDKDIGIQWDTVQKTVTVNISQKKKYKLDYVDWVPEMLKSNGYSMHIKGGRFVTLECELETLRYFAGVLRDSGCASVRYIPRNIDDEMKKSATANGKPIDLTALFPGAEIAMGDDGFPPTSDNLDYKAHNIKIKFRVTDGVVLYPMTYFTKK